MPLYEYECESCGHRFERIQKFSDPPADTCPACGGTVRKLLSSPAIQFKGTGWYVTDYARKDRTRAHEAKGTPRSAAGDAGEASSGKPADKKQSSKSETPTASTSKGDSASGGSTQSSTGGSKSSE